MKKTMFFIVLAFLCFNFSAKAHCKSDQITPVNIGDKVPESFWQQEHLVYENGRSVKQSFAAYKGKLLILDFWATWCSSCIANLPGMEALKNEFAGKMNVRLISMEEEEKIKFFFNKKSNGHLTGLSTVFRDSTLQKMFPHTLIPHYVWISPDGYFLASTSFDEITREQLHKAIDQKDLKASFKIDIDPSKPLFSSQLFPLDRMNHYEVLIKGKVEGVGAGTQFRNSGGILVGLLKSNTALINLYRVLMNKCYPTISPKLIIPDTRHPELIFPPKSSAEFSSWSRENLYSYDLIVPVSKSDSLYQYMLQGLNRYSGFYGYQTIRKVQCLALKLKGRPAKLISKGGIPKYVLDHLGNVTLQNQPFERLVERLNTQALSGPKFFVKDETGFSGLIDITLNVDFNNLPALSKALDAYGLELTEVTRELSVFVIADGRPIQNN